MEDKIKTLKNSLEKLKRELIKDIHFTFMGGTKKREI